MNAINHAATALLIHRKWPGAPMLPVLVGVQLIEVLWVILNLAGIEYVTTEETIRSLRDVHLAYMPWSHSVLITLLLALGIGWGVRKGLRRPVLGMALGIAVASHIVLDLATHVQDIAIAPGLDTVKWGTGLYGWPEWALLVETLYGVWCWRVFRGSRGLLVAIVGFNLVALPFYSAAIPGPEQWFAGRPEFFAIFIGLHILVGWLVIGWLAGRQWRQERVSA